MYQVIIIGSGPAGMTAGVYAVRKGLSTLVLGKEVGGQMAKSGEIENYLGYGVSTGGDLAVAFHEHINKFKNLEHKHGLTVNNIAKANNGFKVSTDQGDFEAETLIITSGRNPRHLNVPGETEFMNKGVSYCDVCDGPLFKGKKVAVVGGGNSGMEAAISLAKLSPEVTIINVGKKLTGDEVLKNKISKEKNIKIIHEATTTKIIGNKFVSALEYKEANGSLKTIEVGGVFIEIGYIPSIDFDKLTKKDKFNQIVTDINCQTSIPGIFAAGDVTNIRDNQIIIAAGAGAKAALSVFYYLNRK